MKEFWWRSWHGAPMDHKWSVIAARTGIKPGIVSAIAWALFDYASQQDERGTVDGFDVETYSVYSGFSEDEITSVIQAMTDKEIIVDGRLTNWKKIRVPRANEISPIRKSWLLIRRKISKEIFSRYDNKCNYCGSTENLEIDHIIPLSRGGTNDPDNLQILCKTCNRKKWAHVPGGNNGK